MRHVRAHRARPATELLAFRADLLPFLLDHLRWQGEQLVAHGLWLSLLVYAMYFSWR